MLIGELFKKFCLFFNTPCMSVFRSWVDLIMLNMISQIHYNDLVVKEASL